MSWVSDDEILGQSRGKVTSPESYDFITHVPAVGGLFCPAIFGATPWAEDSPEITAALKALSKALSDGEFEYEVFAEKRRQLLRYRLTEIANDSRSEHCGHIELPVAVPRPEGPARRIIGVVPPAYRRFRLLSQQEERAAARARRAELIALADTDDWPYGDESLESALASEGLSTEEDAERADRGVLREHPLNAAYREVLNRANRIRRLMELGAPPELIDEETPKLASACDNLDVLIRSAQLPASLP